MDFVSGAFVGAVLAITGVALMAEGGSAAKHNEPPTPVRPMWSRASDDYIVYTPVRRYTQEGPPPGWK